MLKCNKDIFRTSIFTLFKLKYMPVMPKMKNCLLINFIETQSLWDGCALIEIFNLEFMIMILLCW